MSLGLFSLEQRRPRAALMALCSSLPRGGGGAGADLFSLVTDDRTRGDGREMCQGGLGWVLGKGSSPRGWWSPGTGSPGRHHGTSLAIFQKHLAKALRAMV